MAFDEITDSINSRRPVSRQQLEWLHDLASDEQLSQLSTLARGQYHMASKASYVIMGIINYTNICVANCDYCSFFRLPHEKGGYSLSFKEVCQKIDALVALGATMAAFNGGFNPRLKIAHYTQLFKQIHERYPDLVFYDMTVAEFMFICKSSRVDYTTGAKMFLDAGTQWITGGGAEILDDAFRKRHSPGKYTVADYFSAQEAILNAGLRSTATMVIGFDESLEERMNHLERLREFQTQNQGRLASFLCWVYKPENNSFGGKELPLRDYLRWIAICRIYLHNFKTIRTSVLTKNSDALLSLNYGADDFDLPISDEVTELAGATISHDFSGILETAKKSGFLPEIRGEL